MYITNKGAYLQFATLVHDTAGCRKELAGDITKIIGKDKFNLDDSDTIQKLSDELGLKASQVKSLAVIADKTNFYSKGVSQSGGNNDKVVSTEELANLLMVADADDNNNFWNTGWGSIYKTTLDGIISSNPVDIKEVKAEDKKTEAKAKRKKVADKDEDQNDFKARLGGRGEKYGWTDYARELAVSDVTSVSDIQKLFGITEKAAKAIYYKAKEFKPNDITDGVGCVLQDIDQHDGAWNGDITIGKFNDYVEGLLTATHEKTEKEKKTSSSGGGGGSSSKVEINNPSTTETKALEEKIAALEKEIAELKKADEEPVKEPVKKNGSKKWLLAGAGILAAGAAFFAIKERRDRQQMHNRPPMRPQPFCPPPLPFCPPPPPRFCATPFNGPANQNMFGNVFAQG